MAGNARIWNVQCFRSRRGDEAERMRSDVDVGNGLLDLRHVAVHTFIPDAAGFMMCVRLDGLSMGAVR